MFAGTGAACTAALLRVKPMGNKWEEMCRALAAHLCFALRLAWLLGKDRDGHRDCLFPWLFAIGKLRFP